MTGKVHRTAWITAAFVAVIFVSTEPVLNAFHLHLNYSASVPVGLYQESATGPYVGFCLPLPVTQSALQAGLRTTGGRCPGGVAPLLKPLVSATPEHPLRYSDTGFFVDGKAIRNTAPKSTSTSGVPLTHYPFGTYTTGLWAISSFNRSSFDSRYFGPIDPTSVRFHVHPFLLF